MSENNNVLSKKDINQVLRRYVLSLSDPALTMKPCSPVRGYGPCIPL